MLYFDWITMCLSCIVAMRGYIQADHVAKKALQFSKWIMFSVRLVFMRYKIIASWMASLNVFNNGTYPYTIYKSRRFSLSLSEHVLN